MAESILKCLGWLCILTGAALAVAGFLGWAPYIIDFASRAVASPHCAVSEEKK